MRGGELVSLLPSHCCDKIPDRSNLRKERLVVATAHARGKVMGRKYKQWLHCVHSEEEVTTGAQRLCPVLCLSLWDRATGSVFRAGRPSSGEPTSEIVTPRDV